MPHVIEIQKKRTVYVSALDMCRYFTRLGETGGVKMVELGPGTRMAIKAFFVGDDQKKEEISRDLIVILASRILIRRGLYI